MIARIWHGIVSTDKADAYLDKMNTVAIPDYRATPGNIGAWCLRRSEGAIVHFEMLTFWTGLEAIKGFAGEDIGQAKYYDFDDAFLIEKEASVRHYEVSGQADLR